MSSYLDLLRRADGHFQKILREQPQNLQCRRGCTLCCHGLFEIGAADVSVIAKGLAELPREVRDDLIARAERLMTDTGHPDLREATERDKDEFFHRTSKVPCPALGEAGECRIYEHRPLVCRTYGLPLRDGRRYFGDECELNFNLASDEEKTSAAWDLQWEDIVGPEDQFTVAEAIVLASRLLK